MRRALGRRRRRFLCRRARDFGRQAIDGDQASGGEGHGAPQRVFQLAHVAGEIVRGQRLGGFPGEMRGAASPGRGTPQEMGGQQFDVTGAIAQRRQFDAEDAQR